MSWDKDRQAALRRSLAGLYPKDTPQRTFIKDVGLNASVIGFDPSAESTWFNIIEEARKHNKLDLVLKKARDEYPDDDSLKLIEANTPPKPLQGPLLTGKTAWRGLANARPVLEKIMGERSTLVSVAYLELGLLRSRSVARVRLADGNSGTGFLVANNLLITNHHVLPDEATAAKSVAHFNYQQTLTGLSAKLDERALKPDLFFAASKADDWAAVRVEGQPSREWGTLALKDTKIGINSPVNIIQHPEGGFKKLSYAANVVVFVGGGRVQYLTDTMPGSSGAPVFDANWNLDALHHSGGWIAEPGSDEGETFYRNEGILIGVVIEGLMQAGAL